MRRWIAISILMLFIVGCARLEIRKATPSDLEGLRFYRPGPYLWVTVNDHGQCIPSIAYLPDTSQEYIIVAHAGFGSTTFKPTLKDGWNLTAFDASVDTKVAESLNAIGGLLGKIAPGGLLKTLAPTPKPISPGLYRLVFKDGIVADVLPIFQISDQTGKPVACPALVGAVSEKPKPEQK